MMSDRSEQDVQRSLNDGERLPISVLMAVYHRDDPSHLRDAINSILRQSKTASEFILVADGPLSPALYSCLSAFRDSDPPLTIIWKPRNEGLAKALQDGLKACRYEIVARMDSDDVSAATRFECQYDYLMTHPDVDILASIQPEFSTSPDITDRVKTTPEYHDQIVKALRYRNAISHPSVIFRKPPIEQIGGYRDVNLLEDYDLWLRAARFGLKFGCVQKSLLHMRVTNAQKERRGGAKYAWQNVRWRFRMFLEGNYSLSQFLLLTPLYAVFHFTPAYMKGALYRAVRSKGR